MNRFEPKRRKENNKNRVFDWMKKANDIESFRIKNLPLYKKKKIVKKLESEIYELEKKMAYTLDFEAVEILINKIKDKNLILAKYLF